MKISVPYGKSAIICEIPEERLRGVLYSRAHDYKAKATESSLVREALGAPTGSPPLRELVKGKKRVVIITSDHTRPVPSGITMPLLLEEIRAGNPDAEITLLVATGLHRNMTREEIAVRFGPELSSSENIVVHDCHDEKNLVALGTLPSGGSLVVNRLVVECDLLISEGFIEPHFFAGYSGGRKVVLPGVAGYKTVLANHCSEFIAHDMARTGILDGNPIHGDMIFAAKTAKLAFILNVVLDADKKIIAAFAGDSDAAHREGCDFLKSLAGIKPVPADIVITGNGGYPLDQNVYQAVKAMTGAEASILPGGVIVIAAECCDGHGGEAFYDTFKSTRSAEQVMRAITARGRDETLPDQWQSQIFLRVLLKHKVVMVSSVAPEMIEHLNMIPAASLQDAVAKAEELLGKKDASVTVIPDGVSVIIE
ncbi:MAG: nickel-dependent lactate racemase, partial [Synergistaceae bacterium]|nr:nickel-dependent lactate racemase [Synergistaceae bacterium]